MVSGYEVRDTSDPIFKSVIPDTLPEEDIRTVPEIQLSIPVNPSKKLRR